MWALIEELNESGYLLDEDDNTTGFYEISNALGVPVGSIDTNAQNVAIYINFEENRVADERYSNIVKKFLPEEYHIPIIPERLKTEA